MLSKATPRTDYTSSGHWVAGRVDLSLFVHSYAYETPAYLGARLDDKLIARRLRDRASLARATARARVLSVSTREDNVTPHRRASPGAGDR